MYFRDSKGTRRGGLLPPHLRVYEGQLRNADCILETPEEADFFDAIDEPYREPWSRT